MSKRGERCGATEKPSKTFDKSRAYRVYTRVEYHQAVTPEAGVSLPTFTCDYITQIKIMGGWKIADTSDGRKYYYRGKDTSWSEPADYDGGDPWMTAQAPDGRSYFYHVDTKETKWEHPGKSQSAVQVKQEPTVQVKQEPGAEDAGSGFVAGGGRGLRDDYGAPDRRMDRRDGRYADLPQKPSGGAPWEGRFEGRHESRHEGLGFRGPMPVKTDEPEYGSQEQNEEAFFKLLRKHDISPDTPWSEALRQVVRERDYRAIKDPLERQQAFEKYCRETREEEKGKELERQKKMREDFRQMLSTHDEIVHYTRWKTARPMIEREAVFKSSKNEEMKRQFFEEYVAELKRKHVDEQRAERWGAKKALEAILRALIHDSNTTWTAAREMVESNERFANEPQFRALSNVDVLTAFDAHMRTLDAQINDKKKRESVSRIRRERKARDDFKNLLQQLRMDGKIKAGAKWKDLHSRIADDERYHRLLATHGSSPLDLFRDVVEEEERLLRPKKNSALDVLEDQRFEMTIETDFAEFSRIMKTDQRTDSFSEDEVRIIYERLMDKVKKRVEENNALAERQQRDAMDELRGALKHLDPPVRIGDTYEDVLPRLRDLEEYKKLDNDDARRTAFDKYIRRLKAREDDLDRERPRRERDRDHRNGSRRYDDRADRRRTRSPEQNAYEADRRKAQADRERLHRRGSFGLSPPLRDRRDERGDYYRDDRYRRRDDRDRDRDRDRHESIYERERREREMERERSYISRADPRDVGIALHYGDEDDVGSGSRPGSVRKRRDSEGSRKRDAKVCRPLIEYDACFAFANLIRSVAAAHPRLQRSRCSRRRSRRCRVAARRARSRRSEHDFSFVDRMTCTNSFAAGSTPGHPAPEPRCRRRRHRMTERPLCNVLTLLSSLLPDFLALVSQGVLNFMDGRSGAGVRWNATLRQWRDGWRLYVYLTASRVSSWEKRG